MVQPKRSRTSVGKPYKTLKRNYSEIVSSPMNLKCLNNYSEENEIMKLKFKIGDKVKLMSGGPDMTIRGSHFDVLSNEYKYDMFDCIWFEKNKDQKREVHYCPFHADELMK